MASWMHSNITSRPTGRSRSRRLRTDRVVLSNSSTDATSIRSLPGDKSKVDCAGLVDAQHGQGASEAEKHRDAQGEIEDLLVGERVMKAFEERVVHRRVVGCEAFGVLDGKSLTPRVAGVAGVRRDIVVELRC